VKEPLVRLRSKEEKAELRLWKDEPMTLNYHIFTLVQQTLILLSQLCYLFCEILPLLWQQMISPNGFQAKHTLGLAQAVQLVCECHDLKISKTKMNI
jgi:hypothetical protein